jgi:hypothetical protein
MLIFRNRKFKHWKWKEFLLVPKLDQLTLPDTLPDRYKNRIITQSKSNEIPLYEVLSSYADEPEPYTKSAILLGQGLWIVKDDCIPKGEFIPCKIKGRSQFMGIQISEIACKAISNASEQLWPYSVYHGTAQDNLANILKEGLKETAGMLGSAVYAASFWKACRFASLGQTYKFRKGCVIRMLLFSERALILPSNGQVCSCCLPPANVKADHFGNWRKKGFDSIRALACTNAVGVCKDGSAKYILRNEEWAFSSELALLTHYASINPDTQCAPHYDPLHRETQIL